MKSLKVSVITVSYNSEASIEKTIQSVANQTYQNIEYIIIDGASKDKTVNIIKKYSPLFEDNFSWVSEPDKGIYDAMNKGILKATGDIIGLVNSDDWLENDAIEKIVRLVELSNDNPENCLYCGSICFHYINGKCQPMYTNCTRFYAGIKNYSFNHGAYHPAIFVGKNVYKTVGLFDERFKYAADIDFIARSYNAGHKFYFTKDVISNMMDGGVSNGYSLKNVIYDKKLSFKKRNIKGIKAFFLLFYFCSKLFVKSITPHRFIEFYRKSTYQLK